MERSVLAIVLAKRRVVDAPVPGAACRLTAQAVGIRTGGSTVRFRTTAAAFGIALPLAMAAPPADASDISDVSGTRLPLGKENFAIAMGSLDAASNANWVRLGQYTFSEDGTVSVRYWHWSQHTREVRASTGNPAVGCTPRDCTVLTAARWQSSATA
ncbi:hypothetical protein ACFQ07_09680, partial [Actinomadura adrarensis]